MKQIANLRFNRQRIGRCLAKPSKDYARDGSVLGLSKVNQKHIISNVKVFLKPTNQPD